MTLEAGAVEGVRVAIHEGEDLLLGSPVLGTPRYVARNDGPGEGQVPGSASGLHQEREKRRCLPVLASTSMPWWFSFQSL